MDCQPCLNRLPLPKPCAPSPTRSRLPPKPRGRRRKREIVTYVETETARRIKMLAAQHDTTLQALGVEAWHLLLERYGGRAGSG